MSRILIILSTTAVLACAGIIPRAHAGPGEDAADLMATYYNKKVTDCGVDRPAYLCSGLLIRGTQHGDTYKAWNPSPGSVKNGGVSFSYLRTDSKYDRLAYQMQNGYVLSPPDTVSAKELKPNVLCFYPLDALTDNRADQGCGDNADTPEIEKMCNLTGIDSAQKWLNQFNGFPASTNQVTARRRSCGYDVKASLGKDAVTNFNTVLGTMVLMGNTSFHRQNEIRLNIWEQNKQDSLPIMAFIYTSYKGLASARLDQRDLYNSSSEKRWIPIVHVTLPTVPTLDAKFTYDLKDQDIGPVGTPTCNKFIEKAVWGTAFVKEIKKSVPQLSVTPTACGRTMSSTDIPQAMTELTAYRNSDWDSSRDNSVAAQMRCLRGAYPNNETWKVEPFRPYLSDMDTDKARCNPYGVPDLVVAEPTPVPSPNPTTTPTVNPTPSLPPSSTETPQEILERISKNFNSQRTANNPCLEEGTANKRGHYYCSGVLVRTVGAVSYFPWDYSTNAINMGSTSYSWLRRDIKSETLMYPTGFIIRAPSDSIAKGLEPLDVGWECLYAFDAFTILANGWRGCDFRGDNVQYPNTQLKLSNRNAANVYGSCGEVNVKTKADWLNFMRGKQSYNQCSWDVEYPEYWDAMIEVQNTKTFTVSGWNEILLKNQNYADRKKLAAHIDAYFYDVNRTNAQSAKRLQLFSRWQTGRIVPVFRLNFKAAPEERFSYLPGDQLGMCDVYVQSTEWTQYKDRNNVMRPSLHITPTPCGRKQAKELSVGSPNGAVALFHDELTQKDAEYARRSALKGSVMLTQVNCQVFSHPDDAVWSVEPERVWPANFNVNGPNCDPE